MVWGLKNQFFGHLGPKDLLSQKFRTFTPIFPNKTSSWSKPWDESNKSIKNKICLLMAWVLITQFGPIHPKTQYFVLTSSSNIYTQEIVLSRIMTWIQYIYQLLWCIFTLGHPDKILLGYLSPKDLPSFKSWTLCPTSQITRILIWIQWTHQKLKICFP